MESLGPKNYENSEFYQRDYQNLLLFQILADEIVLFLCLFV